MVIGLRVAICGYRDAEVPRFLGFSIKDLGYWNASTGKGYVLMVSIYNCRGSSSSYKFMGCCLLSRLMVIGLVCVRERYRASIWI